MADISILFVSGWLDGKLLSITKKIKKLHVTNATEKIATGSATMLRLEITDLEFSITLKNPYPDVYNNFQKGHFLVQNSASISSNQSQISFTLPTQMCL